MIDTEKNHKIHDAKLFAIIENFCHWHHYFEQPYHIMEVLIDYSNLYAFMSTDKLILRQMQ